ncbi:hypothetical protein [Sporomusa acidovorans]|uniref:Uncharacterized protein n=1 Tax=Sporomusa acidovorans (strain ATCC 49682 / DSM 3132 / Mol) TaxID=1123286 RepID=A0ABZ3JAQ2_SPOA4|nr:hypothetical protein [Sporomusa acidovorans]OZC21700.1 hypothetical protein SPACI_17750 [Sporomusa acidovorans DSM 3132]SDD59751.1 hypothetical protein SAMN04488499_1002158 [Sporomusa acidovorans]
MGGYCEYKKTVDNILASSILSTGTVVAASIGNVVDISGDYLLEGREF